MQTILESVQPVVEQARDVRINPDAIEAFADRVTPENIASIEHALQVDDLQPEEAVAMSFVYNTVNFCYWGNPKWTIQIEGQEHDGGSGMWEALRHAHASGYDILSADYLADLPKADLAQMLSGNIQIPLFEERLNLLRSMGRTIAENYDGLFTSFVEEADYDAEAITKKLAFEMPNVFGDSATYNHRPVHFYKRAQLIPADLHNLFKQGQLERDVTNFDKLTAFADYKVPQVLRKLGILEYSDELAEAIDTLQTIPAGSDEEIEIRAATVWATELATRQIRETIPEATAALVDGYLWVRGQDKSPDDKPYHRTSTIWY